MDRPKEGMAIPAAPTMQLVLFLVEIGNRNERLFAANEHISGKGYGGAVWPGF